MSSELSKNAIYRVLCFLEDDDRGGKGENHEEEKEEAPPPHPCNVSSKWNYVFVCTRIFNPPPPADYFRTLQFSLFLKHDLNAVAMRAIFDHGAPLVFDRYFPRLLVARIIEAFQELRSAPASLDVTLAEPPEGVWCVLSLSALWPQVYVDHLPCGACTQVDEGQRRVIETFHFSSTHFVDGPALTVELHFALEDLSKDELQKVAIRLDSYACNRHVPSSGGSRSKWRSRNSLLLVPEYAAVVYAFVDRVAIGGTLLANSTLGKLIGDLQHLLPVHHLTCTLKNKTEGGDCWMVLHHDRRDPPFEDVRRLKIHSAEASATDCALIRRYLLNSYLADFRIMPDEARFALKMVSALSDWNFSVGRLCLRAEDAPLTDYRSLNTVFGGGLRLTELNLRICETHLGHLIRTTDFWRLPTVQALSELKLLLVRSPDPAGGAGRRPVISSSLWIGALQLLGNCAHYRVIYDWKRNMDSIALKLVRVCERFERGEITVMPECFTFSAPRRVDFPFNGANRVTQAPKGRWAHFYRFRNALTGRCLEVYVGHRASNRSVITMLHFSLL
ncbi:hypothetical protein AAVH_02230 [Aphelenchoides avenae]|nr:hypothetical protein AAVH_02230 [Aphelenchus avenae]